LGRRDEITNPLTTAIQLVTKQELKPEILLYQYVAGKLEYSAHETPQNKT